MHDVAMSIALLYDGNGLPQLTGILTLVMILLTVAAFCALWIYILVTVWKSSGGTPPVFNDAVQYLAPVLTALVGGIVAMVFGVSIAQPPHSGLHASLALVSFTPATWAYGVYVISYLLLGAVSGVTWVARSSVTPPLVKNFAMSAVGLLVAVVGASFGIKS
jgi:hypothetical protein